MITSVRSPSFAQGRAAQPVSPTGARAMALAERYLGQMTAQHWASLGIPPAVAAQFANGLCASFVSSVLRTLGLGTDTVATASPPVLEGHLAALGWREVHASQAPRGAVVFYTAPIVHAGFFRGHNPYTDAVEVLSSNNEAFEPQTVRLDLSYPKQEGRNMRIYAPPDTFLA